jgi:uncharacterized DUF497 family protein
MSASTAKQKVLEAIEKLPADASARKATRNERKDYEEGVTA